MILSLINIYLFENETDLLDKLDKISNIVFAFSTFFLSILIFIYTIRREDKKDKKNQRIDFLKTLLLENNSSHLFNFFEQTIDLISLNRNQVLSDPDKSTLIQLMIDEHQKYRVKFYDLILPFDSDVYNEIKIKTDELIDDITIKVFDQNINFFNDQHINIIEQNILSCRTETLKILLKVR